jgi:hypothetical protein
MLNVAIAVDSATDYGPQADRVVSAACEEVIGEKRCPIGRDLPPGTVAAWYAIVHPNDAGLSSLRIEFRDRTADGVLIEERALTFTVRDSLESRLASAGSVIAALVAAREGPLGRPSWPSNVVRPAARPDAQRTGWSVELAPLALPALGDGPSRWGGFGGVRLGFSGRPFILVAASATTHPGNPSFSWWTLSAGGGARLGTSAETFDLELHGEAVVERTYVAAESGATHDSASEDGWGGRVGVTAVWAAWRRASLILGVDGTYVLPRIGLVVAQGAVQHVSAATLGLSAGVRFQP